MTAVPVNYALSSRPASLWPVLRWLVLMLIALGSAWVLLNVDAPYSVFILALIAVAPTAVLGGRAVAQAFARPSLRWLRGALAYVFAVTAITLMMVSAYAFDPAANILLLGEATFLLLVGGVLLGLALHLAAPTTQFPTLPSIEKIHYRLPFHGRYFLSSVVLLSLLAFIRVIQTPLTFESSPNTDLLLFSVLTWLKTHSIFATVRGDIQFVLLLSGVVTLALGLGAVRLALLQQMSFLFGLVTLTLLSEINGKVFKLLPLEPVSTNVQFWMLVLGIGFVVLGLGNWRWPQPGLRDRQTFWIVVGLTVLALVLRFWQLNDSVRFFVDELSFADAVHSTWVRPNLEILAPMESIAAFPYMFAYLASQGVELFGRTFIGLRAMGALLGALGVPALYLLARALFDKRTALMAALLLATFPPHIHFSRIAISEIAGPLFGTLALAFLARGVLHNRRGDYVLGGAMLGLTHYFHEGSRVVFTPLAVLWVLALILIYRPRVQITHVLLAVLTTIMVALPIYYTLVGMARPLAARMVDNNSALSGAYWRELFESGNLLIHIQQHVIPPLLIYVNQIENTLFYKGETALLLTVILPAFFVGLFYAVWRWRVPGLLLLVLWWAAVTAGNMIMVDSVGSPRYVMVFPALMLLAAVGLRYGLALLWNRVSVVMLALLTIMLAGVQANYYFNEHLPTYNRQFRNNWPHRDGQDAVLRLLQLPPGTQMHIVSEVVPNHFDINGLLMFMSSDYPRLNVLALNELTLSYLAGLKRNIGQAFFIEPRHNPPLNALRAHFPALPTPQESPFDLAPEKQFLLYYLPPQGSGR